MVVSAPKVRALVLVGTVAACGPTDGFDETDLVIVKGPYLQHATPDAVSILWETSRPSEGAVYYLADRTWHTLSGPSRQLVHEVRLTQRAPSEEIRYVVESIDDTGARSFSAETPFRMAPELGTPFRMALWGDSQERPAVFARLVDLMRAARPDLLVGLGDYVDAGSVYEQWGERLFGPLQPLIRSTPMIAALGNHDEQASWFLDLVAQPGNERWFSYAFGNAFFLVLDTNEPFARGTEQYDYAVEQLLSEPAQRATWLFVVHHHPPYSEIYEERIYEQLRAHLVPLYESAGVDVNFHGHIHDYERGEYVPADTGRRTWHVQSSGGGGTLWWDEYDGEWEQIDVVILDEHHFVLVDVGTTELELQAINLAGVRIDHAKLEAEARFGRPPSG